MIKLNFPGECCGCSACANVCPKKCINMKVDAEGFLYPEVDETLCVDCGLCNKVCPFFEKETHNTVYDVYAAYNLNTDVKRKSSSGGVFTALAESTLKNGGVVFGVVMNTDCRGCHHVMIENHEDIDAMRSSKYIQSVIGEAYKNAKTQLDSGREVLFSGTPCQINGLKGYLRKDYSNLFCIDVICHGVPSEKLWDRYVDKIEKKFRRKIQSVNFRYKYLSWKKFGTEAQIKGTNSRQLIFPATEFGYFLLFKYDLCLRPSCYQCKAKETRYSDLTVGDYWGLEKVHPELNNIDGVSALIVRTTKGKSLINRIKEQVVLVESQYSSVVQDNKAEYKSVNRPIERENFYSNIDKYSLSKIERMYLYKGIKQRLKKALIDIGIWKVLRGG